MIRRNLFLFLIVGSAFIQSCSSDEESELVEVEVDPPGAPPKTWTEHIGSHKATVKRVFYDDDVAIYYDSDMDPKITWTYKYIGDMWRHIKDIYQCTPDQRLFAILHGKGGSGTASYFYSDAWDYRNTIDCSSDSWEQGDWPNDLITHEMFHVVESVAFGVDSYSAGFGEYPGGIWGDSEFAPIFQYDLYKWYGMDGAANRWESAMKNSFTNHPSPDTYWSRNWFLPIYQNYGKTEVLVNFFRLVGEHFPDDRKLNIGEFVHFFSGAADADLKSYAEKTFGWNETYESELVRAREEFSMIEYQ